MPYFSESILLQYPDLSAIANIPQSTWEMDGEEAKFIADFPRRDRARSKSKINQNQAASS
jgi:hypothetical protein